MNYGDTIYYVNEIIKLLEHSLKLDLDPSMTADHLTDEILFADNLLDRLYEESAAINGLSYYEDALRSIMKSKYKFCSFLDALLEGGEPLKKRVHLDDQQTESIRRKHETDIERIENHFAEKDNFRTPEDLVSQEEFRYLFGVDEDEQ